ncbi:P-loop containing nucleoside triphosphate hydrolase protein [Coniella lustricola]|uniref:P-loop containing nucleoside triphosphate hydrolase protein n=1 Tax=Coniella lustricola TaxID=2025994 RepID=A0A2T3ACZ9_9PEZI|nr:P-loop containing nucleoside triphosphate hydrolase protein [Coniella lustricola]
MATNSDAVDASATLGFAIASIVISSVFLALLPLPLCKLYKARSKVQGNWHGRTKFAFAALLSVTLLVILVLEWQDSPSKRLLPAVAILLSFIAAAALCCLLSVAHSRSPEPSSLAVIYLLASAGCDVLWLLFPGSHNQGFSIPDLNAVLVVLQVVVKLALLLLESSSKQGSLHAKYQSLSPEETAGLVQRVLFWWINPIIIRGTGTILKQQDLPPTGQSFSSEHLRRIILRSWDQRGKPENTLTLPLVLLRCLQRPFRAAILPRLFLTLFRYAQPVLIQQTIRFVSRPSDHVNDEVDGFWILFAAFCIYSGIALSTVLYQGALARLQVQTRGALVSLIYAKLLDASTDTYDSGRAVTLMSTDVDGLSGVSQMFHELWGHVLEVLIGITMLYRLVSWLWVVPLILIFFCSRVSKYVAQHLKARQKSWTMATQDRIATTTTMLSSIKSVKILGVSNSVAGLVQKARVFEIERAKSVRWMMALYNASANALGIFTPAVTMILYVVLANVHSSRALDVETAFTTIAILSMVTHPANMVMTIVPRAIASLASFERIQNYLIDSARHDPRIDVGEDTLSSSEGTAKLALRFKNVSVQIRPAQSPILEDVSLDVERGQILVCSGPVGSGKSVLAKTILGEMPISQGSVGVHTRNIGFCSQNAWLPDGTIRQAVCGLAEHIDTVRYAEAISACCLGHDISNLPDGDETGIGSRGINLSGGQKQRLALARLVYTQCRIVVLDDSFCALDGKTEYQVIKNLLGPQGVFRQRNTTVVWISNGAQYFNLADQVIIMNKSKMVAQGHWMQVRSQIGFDLTSSLKTSSAPGEASEQSTESLGLEKLQKQKRAARDLSLDIKRKSGDLSLYGFYIKYAGPINVLLSISCTAIHAVSVTFPSYWLKWWTEADTSAATFYIVGYVFITLTAWVSTNGIMISTFLMMAVKSGLGLHDLLLVTVMRAPLSYFSNVEMGSLLNRFSQDIQLIDGDLPTAFSSLVVQIAKLSVQVALLLTVQRLMLLAMPFCLLVVYIVQRFYLMTSRQLRLLDLESRSAVFSSFLETVEGLTTLRAFGWQRLIEKNNLRALDDSQRALYIMLCLQRWLNLVLDLIIASIAIITIALAIKLKGSMDGAAIGVALNVVLVANTTLLKLVESFTSLEISLGAISRLKSVKETTPLEDKLGEDVDLSEMAEWPSCGEIELHGVDAFYEGDITLKLAAGSKVAICGRTGSGKSTLILTLLHLVEYTGMIRIDGIDISKIPRSLVRQRCFISIPQDPFLMPHASLRLNLDESESVPDEVLATSLTTVQLWAHFWSATGWKYTDNDGGQETSEDREQRIAVILETRLSALPVLSGGQMQLLALARALVKKWVLSSSSSSLTSSKTDHTRKPPLLLDEATASLDPVTEGIVCDVIDREFSEQGHTVIMVTHRPSMLARRMRGQDDMVVFLADGRVESVRRGGQGGVVRLEDVEGAEGMESE